MELEQQQNCSLLVLQLSYRHRESSMKFETAHAHQLFPVIYEINFRILKKIKNHVHEVEGTKKRSNC